MSDTASVSLLVVRQLVTAPLPPTSSPPPPAVAIQAAPPAKGAAAAAASAAAVAPQPPATPPALVTYPWTFTLPYFPSPSHLLSRFVLSRADEDAAPAGKSKDPKRSKTATASALPAPPAEAVDPNVTLTLHCPATACLLHVYDYDEWQHSSLPTHTLLSACEGEVDGRMKAERRVIDEGELVVEALPLTRERPLLVEVFIDPHHLSDDVQTFHTQQQLNRTVLPSPASSLLSTTASLPAPSPSAKTAKKPAATEKKAGAASAAVELDEPARESWPFTLIVVAASAAGVAVQLDVTSEERRRERRAEREKAEPGRARRARTAREHWLEEEKKWKDGGAEEESKEQMLVEYWPEEKEEVTLVSAEERQAEKERRAAEAEEASSFRYVLGELRRIQAQVEDAGDKEDERSWKEWRERQQQAVLQEKAERAQLRTQQQQEQSDMQAVQAIIAARAQERELERERKAAEANTQRSEAAKTDKPAAKAPAATKPGKDAKAAKADATVPPQQKSRVDVRREYVARLEAAVQALLAVEGSRQWKVRGLVEQVREEERREAREECELCTAAADNVLAQGDVDEAEERTEEEPVTQRKDGKAGKATGKDPKAEKAEKERREAEGKAKLERERKRKEDKVQAITALAEALTFSEEVTAVAGNEQHDAMTKEAKQKCQEKVRGEVTELLGRMDRAEQVESEETERLKAMSTTGSSLGIPDSARSTATITASPRPTLATSASPRSARQSVVTAIADIASPSSASSTVPAAVDLTVFLSSSYGAQLSRLQQLSLFVESLLAWLDGGEETSAEVRSACEARLLGLRQRWEAELMTRRDEEARAAAATAATPAAKGKGKGK